MIYMNNPLGLASLLKLLRSNLVSIIVHTKSLNELNQHTNKLIHTDYIEKKVT